MYIKFTAMKFKLPELPYAQESLEPAISRQTMEFHYGKHLQTYIDNLNKLIEGTPFAEIPLEQIVKQSDGGIFNNAAQTFNHTFYFETFSPNGQRHPEGKLAKAIEKKWGNFEAFREEFSAAAVSLFGSGWAWLSKNADGELTITKESNAGCPLTSGLVPLLTIDVWEHAYYLDCQNRRAEYVKKLWDIIDWSIVEKRFE